MATKQTTTDERLQAERQENSQVERRRAGGLFRDEFSLLSPRETHYSNYSNPFQWMHRMSDEMDRAFLMGRGREVGERNAWSPSMEVLERDGNYIVRAELPGLKPEQVKVEVTEGELIIKGERKCEHDESVGGYRRSECQYGQFFRSVSIPEGVDPGRVRARFENGMLEVTIPAPPQKQVARRQIPIEGATVKPEPHG